MIDTEYIDIYDQIVKVCPFCGSEDLTGCVDGGCLPSFISKEKQNEILSETPYVTTCSIECNECGARIEGYAASNDIDFDVYHGALIDCLRKWNRRV